MRDNVFFHNVVHRSKRKVAGVNIARTVCDFDVVLSVVRDTSKNPFYGWRTNGPVDCVLCLAEES